MGIIDSLSAGYRFVSRRPGLLILPLLLDALLWAMPRLSVEPLLARLARFYTDMASGTEGLGPDLVGLSQQLNELLAAVGETINLAYFLVSRSLYHVPSLLAALPSLKGEHPTVEIASVGTAGLLSFGFGLAGLFLGVVYMNLLAQNLPLGEGPKELPVGRLAGRIVRHWLRTLGFLGLVFGVLLLIYIPGILGISVLTLLSPALGSGAMFLFGGLVAVILFYLYFVTAALVLDNLAIAPAVRRSIRLVRHNFWPTVGFALVTWLIGTGMELLFRQITQLHAVGVALATLGNAFVGTGLAMALLVFYRTRVLAMQQQDSSVSVQV